MTETLSRVPWYPLAFPLFYGALALFGLLMARHLRILRAVGPVRPFADVRRRSSALVRYALLQTRMFRDPRAGAMHYAIFAAFVLPLGRDRQRRSPAASSEAVLGAPLGGAIWAALLLCRNVAAVAALVGDRPTSSSVGSSSGRRA